VFLKLSEKKRKFCVPLVHKCTYLTPNTYACTYLHLICMYLPTRPTHIIMYFFIFEMCAIYNV
jgi:hypothetical protein